MVFVTTSQSRPSGGCMCCSQRPVIQHCGSCRCRVCGPAQARAEKKVAAFRRALVNRVDASVELDAGELSELSRAIDLALDAKDDAALDAVVNKYGDLSFVSGVLVGADNAFARKDL